jgi:hypothetical protein
LRSRSWDVLHQLWWICVKERNRLATEKLERARLECKYGDVENEERDKTVQETMKAIVDTMAERQQAYKEAVALARQDPHIDLARRDGAQFTPPAYVCDEEIEERIYANLVARTRIPMVTKSRMRLTVVRAVSRHLQSH